MVTSPEESDPEVDMASRPLIVVLLDKKSLKLTSGMLATVPSGTPAPSRFVLSPIGSSPQIGQNFGWRSENTDRTAKSYTPDRRSGACAHWEARHPSRSQPFQNDHAIGPVAACGAIGAAYAATSGASGIEPRWRAKGAAAHACLRFAGSIEKTGSACTSLEIDRSSRGGPSRTS